MAKPLRLGVFVRTYDWDASTARSTQRIFAQASGADCFVLADETREPVAASMFRKIAHVADDFARLGLPLVAARGAPLWWNCDYGLYDAALKQPDYDVYLFVEDDVAVNLPLRPIAERMAREGLACVTYAGHRPITEKWTHAASCSDLPYARRTWTPLTMLGVTGEALRFLLAERQRLGRLHAEGAMGTWPFCEGFVSSALTEGGWRSGDLRQFADMSLFGANTSYLETDARVRRPGSIAHAVLAGERYAPKFFTRSLDSLLRTGAYARIAEARKELLAAGFGSFEGYQVRPSHGNLALDRPATQSSMSARSRRPAEGSSADPLSIDARGANCGILTGRDSFYTDSEDRPWWTVDLQGERRIGQVRVFQGNETRDRTAPLALQVSKDGRHWRTVLQLADHDATGGNDAPLIGRLKRPAVARHVRVMLEASGPLHLAEVEIYAWAVAR